MIRCLTIALILTIIISSCKKDKADRHLAMKKQLDATWALCCTGTDVNRNELIDENERIPKSIDDDLRITLKGDGTATWFIRYQGKSFDFKATWALGDTTDLAVYISGYDSFYYKIQSVDSKDLVVIENGAKGTPPPCTIFTRQ